MVDAVPKVSGFFCFVFPSFTNQYYSCRIVYLRVTNNDGTSMEVERDLIALVRRGRYIRVSEAGG